MKTMKLIIAIISLTTLALLTACSGGGSVVSSGTPGNAKTSLKVVFSNASSVSSASSTMQHLGIARLILNVIPVNSTSYTPPQVDLSSITTGSYTIDNLTDNETYLFRIQAYNSSNVLVWGGETPSVVLPVGTTVTVNSLQTSSPSTTLLSDAKPFIASKDMVTAKDKLMLATLSDQQNNEAKMLYALSRIFNLYDNLGNTNSGQLDSIKKILEASGITYLSLNTLSSANHPQMTLPKQLPSTTPTTGQVRDYVRYYLLPEIDAALITLSGFPLNFSTTFSPAAYNLNGSDIAIDYADVQVVTTLLKSAKSAIALACAYNFDVNIVNNINKNITDISNYDKTTQGNLFDLAKVMQSNSSIGTIKEIGMLTTAKAAYNSFISNYETAYNLMKARTNISNHLFVLDYSVLNNSGGMRTESLDKTLNGVKQVQNALNGKTTLTPSMVPVAGSTVYNDFYGTPPQHLSAVRPSSNNTVNFSQFFDVNHPVNLRTAFVDCSTSTLFKDQTIAGIYPLGYESSPIYNDGPGWSSYDGHGGWDIDSIVRNDSSVDTQAMFNGLCGTSGKTYSSAFTQHTVTGQAVKGPTIKATIRSLDGRLNTTTDRSGNFNMPTGMNSPIESRGGRYIDIATGKIINTPTLIAPTGVFILSPLTTLAYYAGEKTTSVRNKISLMGSSFDAALVTIDNKNRNALALSEAVGTVLYHLESMKPAVKVTFLNNVAEELGSANMKVSSDISQVTKLVRNSVIKTAALSAAEMQKINLHMTEVVHAVAQMKYGESLPYVKE